ncbi:MAG TPA: 2-aminoethylphosphonate--pyruvate transaminase [Terracidiphilus sp.]|nr:2-aminoethylphosphonate--pyruvate transaminase [Terracidiphilus sp.]
MHTSKRLFTPGPLNTTETVKAAMLCDMGSRDPEFLRVVREIREQLLEIAGVADTFEAVLMQGSGTYVVESVISSAIPRNGKLLALVNGAYGRRIAQIAKIHGIDTVVLELPENRKFTSADVKQKLAETPGVTHVAVVHCETTTGILNAIEEIGQVAADAGAVYFVDAMSSFGAVDIDFAAAKIDFLVSSANKCIEGVPGFGFVLARRARLLELKGRARTLSMDLYAQWAGAVSDGQFRFTPPIQTLLAFHQALKEFKAEGGVASRSERYRSNHEVLMHGMRGLGFQTYLKPDDVSYIITTFRYLDDPKFTYEAFYERLSDRGFIIYAGKLTDEPCFRIGTIGQLYPKDMEALMENMRIVLEEMSVVIPSEAMR